MRMADPVDTTSVRPGAGSTPEVAILRAPRFPWELAERGGSWSWNASTHEFTLRSRGSGRPAGSDVFPEAPIRMAGRRLHPDDRPRYIDWIDSAVRAGEEWNFEYRCLLSDGTTRDIQSVAHPVFDADGRLVEYQGMEIDITGRKRTEEAWCESHDLLRAVVEGSPDPIFAKDLQGRYRMINSAGARLLGRSVEEVIGKDDGALLSPDAARTIREQDLRILVAGKTETFEETAGDGRIFHSTKAPYRDRQGNVIGLVGVSRDVTDMKRLEAELRQAQKMEAVGQLAEDVAHDFNNLLSIIIGFSELVHHRLQPEDMNRGFLFEVRKAGERAAELTRQLLAFSRKQALAPQVVGLNPLLSDLSRMPRSLLGKNIEPAQDLEDFRSLDAKR
ncbi:MAG TPA: PAS domain-containing protein [Fibrobacteria bacterium]|nr:PAS domain-containing protein [Fibrobacteria bacterium]